jgi:SRSO17 transposase
MNSAELDRVEDLFLRFHARFAPLFGRREARERSEQYLRGLLVQKSERRSAENLAEAVVGATPRTLQLFLSTAPWSAGAVREALQAYVGERLADVEGIFLIDETGFAKQGKKSVGVARQYSGTLGKVGNCQIGVFLTYASAKGHATVDAGLFLPESWTQDRARCRAAGVPEEVGFRTKPEIALDLLRQARQAGHLPGGWVAADEVYGNSPVFRDGVSALGLWYVGDVACDLPVFTEAAPTHAHAGAALFGSRSAAREAAPGPRHRACAAGASSGRSTARARLAGDRGRRRRAGPAPLSLRPAAGLGEPRRTPRP